MSLGRVTPLRNGDVLRDFQFVGPNDRLYDLSRFEDLFLSNRAWLGRIERQ
jgi:hypothetical protein